MTPPHALPPWSEADRTHWQKVVRAAATRRDNILTAWDVQGNLDRYAPPNIKAASGSGALCNTNVDFADVERKKAALLFDTPTIAGTPDAGTPPDLVVLQTELLNGLLSDRYLHAHQTMLKLLQDALLVIQPAVAEIGYVNTTEQVPGDAIDPLTGQPQMLEQVVHEECFFRRISVKALLLPEDFEDTDYDRASFVGYRFRLPIPQARREFGLPPDWTPTGGSSGMTVETSFTQGQRGASAADSNLVGGVKVWYYAAQLADSGVSHPHAIREFVLLDGEQQPVLHRDCPYQSFGPDGDLTIDSIRGYPLRMLALRDLTDSPWVQADSTLTAPLTSEGNTYRTQVLRARDSNRLILLTEVTQIDEGAIESVKANPILSQIGLSVVPVREGALARGVDAVMKQVPTLTLGRETYAGMDRIDRDRERILGLGQNQSGQQTDSKRTATEVQNMQRNTEARFEQERGRVLAYFLGVVRMLSALTLRYGDRWAVQILGQQRAQMWSQGKAALGAFQFELQHDSGKYQDIEDTRRQILQVANFALRSPHVNQGFIWGRIADVMGWPRQEALAEPQPPKPEPPKVTFSVSGPDLVSPAGPLLIEALQHLGFEFSEQAIAQSRQMQGMEQFKQLVTENQPTGQALQTRSAPKAPRLDQHSLDETGQMPGPGPM